MNEGAFWDTDLSSVMKGFPLFVSIAEIDKNTSVWTFHVKEDILLMHTGIFIHFLCMFVEIYVGDPHTVFIYIQGK